MFDKYFQFSCVVQRAARLRAGMAVPAFAVTVRMPAFAVTVPPVTMTVRVSGAVAFFSMPVMAVRMVAVMMAPMRAVLMASVRMVSAVMPMPLAAVGMSFSMAVRMLLRAVAVLSRRSLFLFCFVFFVQISHRVFSRSGRLSPIISDWRVYITFFDKALFQGAGRGEICFLDTPSVLKIQWFRFNDRK